MSNNKINNVLRSKISERINHYIQNSELDNSDLVHLIELLGGYLNLRTIPKYAKQNQLSYNGVKKCRTVVKLFDVKFVIDNN